MRGSRDIGCSTPPPAPLIPRWAERDPAVTIGVDRATTARLSPLRAHRGAGRAAHCGCGAAVPSRSGGMHPPGDSGRRYPDDGHPDHRAGARPGAVDPDDDADSGYYERRRWVLALDRGRPGRGRRRDRDRRRDEIERTKHRSVRRTGRHPRPDRDAVGRDVVTGRRRSPRSRRAGVGPKSIVVHDAAHRRGTRHRARAEPGGRDQRRSDGSRSRSRARRRPMPNFVGKGINTVRATLSTLNVKLTVAEHARREPSPTGRSSRSSLPPARPSRRSCG